MGEERVIDINDETAKLLAQIITNEKALAILHSIEDEPKSLTQIAEELGFPLSTVSYHVERMLKVGLIEVAGKKYGKKLQEVKLYRASNKPILIVPRREALKVTKRLSAFEKLHVISLSVASFFSILIYKLLRSILKVQVVPSGSENNTSPYVVVSTPPSSRFIPGTVSEVSSTNSTANFSTTSIQAFSSSPQGTNLPLYAAIVTFVVVFLITYLILKKNPKIFLRLEDNPLRRGGKIGRDQRGSDSQKEGNSRKAQ